jgi:hypothetical protein
MPKKIFTQELEGTRRRGRPRKRWKEEVEKDLQNMERVSDRWEEIVLNVTLTYNVNMCYSINDNRTVIRKTLKESNLVTFNLQIPICRTTAFLPTCARSTI